MRKALLSFALLGVGWSAFPSTSEAQVFGSPYPSVWPQRYIINTGYGRPGWVYGRPIFGGWWGGGWGRGWSSGWGGFASSGYGGMGAYGAYPTMGGMGYRPQGFVEAMVVTPGFASSSSWGAPARRDSVYPAVGLPSEWLTPSNPPAEQIPAPKGKNTE